MHDHLIPQLPKTPSTHSSPTQLLCSICNEPVPLETAKTDDLGKAIHESCYWLRVTQQSSGGHS